MIGSGRKTEVLPSFMSPARETDDAYGIHRILARKKIKESGGGGGFEIVVFLATSKIFCLRKGGKPPPSFPLWLEPCTLWSAVGMSKDVNLRSASDH